MRFLKDFLIACVSLTIAIPILCVGEILLDKLPDWLSMIIRFIVVSLTLTSLIRDFRKEHKDNEDNAERS